MKGLLLAYDTERRLQKQGLAREWTLDKRETEAGPACFDDTTVGASRGIPEAGTIVAARKTTPFMRRK